MNLFFYAPAAVSRATGDYNQYVASIVSVVLSYLRKPQKFSTACGDEVMTCSKTQDSFTVCGMIVIVFEWQIFSLEQ